MADIEKTQVDMAEDVGSKSSHQDSYECEFTPEEQKKIIHRIDRRLILTVGIMYCVSLMDRTNLSAAAIAGYVDHVSVRSPLLTGNQNDEGTGSFRTLWKRQQIRESYRNP